jgi:hypothetical protein
VSLLTSAGALPMSLVRRGPVGPLGALGLAALAKTHVAAVGAGFVLRVELGRGLLHRPPGDLGWLARAWKIYGHRPESAHASGPGGR